MKRMLSVLSSPTHQLVPQSGVGASSDSDPRLGGDVVEGGRTALDNKTSLLNTPSPRSFAGPRFRDYNPYNYTDSISTLDKAALKEALYEDAVEQLREGETFILFVSLC